MTQYDIPLVVAGSFGNIFSSDSINNVLKGVEVPKMIARLREAFSASPEPVMSEITQPGSD
jgi:homoaconitate hydratase